MCAVNLDFGFEFTCFKRESRAAFCTAAFAISFPESLFALTSGSGYERLWDNPFLRNISLNIMYFSRYLYMLCILAVNVMSRSHIKTLAPVVILKFLMK